MNNSSTATTTTAAAPAPANEWLDKNTAIAVFAAFAAAYFCSALVRAITATLAPQLSAEFALQSRDLGLLAGGYFLGFAAMQLPLGGALDRYGPKRVILCFLSLSVLGCLAFSLASSFTALLASRVLIGMGVSACLMAPLTGYRRWLQPATLMRANSWMLMSGSLGMLASTLPVQYLLPLMGWRPMFWIMAAMILACMAAIALCVPKWGQTSAAQAQVPGTYAEVWQSGYFKKMLPLAFFSYGGLVAVQTLWAAPWMVKVAGYTPLQAAQGLFYINAAMLVTFWAWGLAGPRLARTGWNADKILTWFTPVSLAVLAINIVLGTDTGWLGWALFCMASSVVSVSQPAIGMAFRAALAGRALSAFNLAIFLGVFVVQWGIGLLIDAGLAAGLSQVRSFQAANAVFLCCCVGAYLFFLRGETHKLTS